MILMSNLVTDLPRPAPPILPPGGKEVEANAPQDVLRRVQARDPEGWRLLLSTYGPVVHSWCRRWGLQDADSADVTQEVFCALMRRVDRFRPEHEDALRSWVRVITRNKLRDHSRRQARCPRSGGAQEQLLNVPQPMLTESAQAGQGEGAFHRVLLEVRAELGERTWQAFWRSVVDEQASTKVGEELRMTANAVRKAKARVLKQLREALVGEAGSRRRGASGDNLEESHVATATSCSRGA